MKSFKFDQINEHAQKYYVFCTKIIKRKILTKLNDRKLLIKCCTLLVNSYCTI